MSTGEPRPVPTPTSQPFWDALAEERIRIQHCDNCGGWVHYPRNRCSHCLGEHLSWRELAGAAHVYSFTVARQPTSPAFADEAPRVIAIVELKGGPRLTTNLVGVDADEVHVGMPVAPVFDHGKDGITLLRFAPPA